MAGSGRADSARRANAGWNRRERASSEVLAGDLSGEDVHAFAVLYDRLAVHDDCADSWRVALNFSGVHFLGEALGDEIGDTVRVEDGDVGGPSHLEPSAGQSEFLGGESCDFPHRLLQRGEEMLLTPPVADEAGRRAVPEEAI